MLSTRRRAMAESVPAARGGDRFLVGIVVGAVLLIVLGVVAVGVAARAPTAADVDPASPVGVVRDYVEAQRAGDADRSYGYLSRAARDGVPPDDYRRRFYQPYRPDTL